MELGFQSVLLESGQFIPRGKRKGQGEGEGEKLAEAGIEMDR